MKPKFILNAKRINHITGDTLLDLTGKQLVFRIKKTIENDTPPLFAALATIVSSGSTGSVFYFTIDLTSSLLEGLYYYEFEINNGSGINDNGTAPQVLTKQPEQLLIQERLT